MKKATFTIVLIFASLFGICQTYVSNAVITKPNLNNYGLANLAIGANTVFENNNNLLVKGDVMYSTYSSDSNVIINSFGIDEFDVHFSDNLNLLRNYLLALGSTTVNQTELNNLIFGNGVFEFNNSVNLTNGGGVKFIGDNNSVL